MKLNLYLFAPGGHKVLALLMAPMAMSTSHGTSYCSIPITTLIMSWSHTSRSSPAIKRDWRGREGKVYILIQPKTVLGCSWACPWPQGLKALLKSGAAFTTQLEQGSASPFGICILDHTLARIPASPSTLDNWRAHPALKQKIRDKKVFLTHTFRLLSIYFCNCQGLVWAALQWFKFP